MKKSNSLINDIVFVGAGNLASHLAVALFDKGYKIKQVYSRHLKNARILAKQTGATFTDCLTEIEKNASLYIIALADNAIEKAVVHLATDVSLVVHTSGSVSIDVLKKYKNHGVLYPLQTFSKQVNVDISKIPFLIEANNDINKSKIKHLANSLSNRIYFLNSEQRLKVHLSAVFACNFTNHMYHIAENILCEESITFDIIRPLIIETARKTAEKLPSNIQTGPAVRKDFEIIEKHLAALNDADYKSIYSLLSESIIKRDCK